MKLFVKLIIILRILCKKAKAVPQKVKIK